MSFFAPFASAGGVPVNPALLYTIIERQADGLDVTSGGSNNTLGSYLAAGTVAEDICGFFFEVGGTGGTTARNQWSIRVNGTTVVVPNYTIIPGNVNEMRRIYFPLKLYAGDTLEVALRADTASVHMSVGQIVGVKTSATLYGWPKGFDTIAELVAVDTANTRVSSITIGQSSFATHQSNPYTDPWTTVIASTPHDIGALLPVYTRNTAAISNGKRVHVLMGVGAAGAEVEIGSFTARLNSTAPYVVGVNPMPIFANIPSGSRIAAKALVATVHAENCLIGALECH